MQDLGKALRYQEADIDEPVHAVREACLCFAVELLTGLVHALLPANVVELVDLKGKAALVRLSVNKINGFPDGAGIGSNLLCNLHPLFLHHQEVLQLRLYGTLRPGVLASVIGHCEGLL